MSKPSKHVWFKVVGTRTMGGSVQDGTPRSYMTSQKAPDPETAAEEASHNEARHGYKFEAIAVIHPSGSVCLL